jgi:nucleoid DNA-binding protein
MAKISENKFDAASTIEFIANETGLKKSEVKKVFSAIKKLIERTLEGELSEASLPELGKIKLVTRKARTSRNRKTGEKVEVPPKKAVVIKLKKSISVKSLEQ